MWRVKSEFIDFWRSQPYSSSHSRKSIMNTKTGSPHDEALCREWQRTVQHFAKDSPGRSGNEGWPETISTLIWSRNLLEQSQHTIGIYWQLVEEILHHLVCILVHRGINCLLTRTGLQPSTGGKQWTLYEHFAAATELLDLFPSTKGPLIYIPELSQRIL